jgi:hypothetical protein
MKSLQLLFFIGGLLSLIGCTSRHSETTRLYEGGGVESENGLASFIPDIIKNFKTPVALKPLHYVDWVESSENGLIKNRSIDVFRYTLQYKPLEYMLVKDVGPNALVSKKVYDSLYTQYDGKMEYYTFSIEDTQSGDELIKTRLSAREEYDQRLLYFSFYIQNDLQLVAGKDTFPCTLAHFERTYGISSKANFMLGFPTGKQASVKDAGRTLIYHDPFFGNGIIKLKIEEKDLQKIPVLKLNDN